MRSFTQYERFGEAGECQKFDKLENVTKYCDAEALCKTQNAVFRSYFETRFSVVITTL